MIIAFIGLAKRNLNFEGKISNYMNKKVIPILYLSFYLGCFVSVYIIWFCWK